MSRAAELRSLADQMELVEELENMARDAKEAYRADTDNPELKAAHRAAAKELASLRESIRTSVKEG